MYFETYFGFSFLYLEKEKKTHEKTLPILSESASLSKNSQHRLVLFLFSHFNRNKMQCDFYIDREIVRVRFVA